MVACSALKQKYRDVLCGRDKGQEHVKDVAFVSMVAELSISNRFMQAWITLRMLVLKVIKLVALQPTHIENALHWLQVLLQPSKEVLAKRVQEREALGTHFMPASLLDSQLALMEVDPSAYRYGNFMMCNNVLFAQAFFN